VAGQTGNRRSREAKRYRQVAIDALALLDWCIGYLAAIHKDEIARRVAGVRAEVREQLGEPEMPLPTRTF
jgi:hypothetical protein